MRGLKKIVEKIISVEEQASNNGKDWLQFPEVGEGDLLVHIH